MCSYRLSSKQIKRYNNLRVSKEAKLKAELARYEARQNSARERINAIHKLLMTPIREQPEEELKSPTTPQQQRNEPQVKRGPGRPRSASRASDQGMTSKPGVQ